MAEGVGEAGIQKLCEALPLLVGEACVAPVGFGVFQVDLLMGDVQIAADDYAFAFIQLLQVAAERIIPTNSMIQAGKARWALGV